ncbi:MAG: adenylyltransferase/cytidyltransferase family protein [Firmicutes bacterium]|nr:adenylyltransferase/cytidyltransferase family protein [Bacillota bacterium]
MLTYLAFFGAFNPPTKAHINLAELARAKTGRDKVIFVPSKMLYIRDEQGKNLVYPDEKRLRMLQSIAEERPWMEVYDGEIRQKKQPRTYETLCALREEGKDCCLLLGSDKLPELEHGWMYVRQIAEEFGIVCLKRNGDDIVRLIREDEYLSSLAPYITLIDSPDEMQFISSSAVRERILEIRKLREELGSMVPIEILPFLTGDDVSQ